MKIAILNTLCFQNTNHVFLLSVNNSIKLMKKVIRSVLFRFKNTTNKLNFLIKKYEITYDIY